MSKIEVSEAYESADGLDEHRLHIGEALDKLFSESADGHAVSVYGEPSPELLKMASRMPLEVLNGIRFLQGLESVSSASV